jgi:polar amino acid transport system substrate-binding protein
MAAFSLVRLRLTLWLDAGKSAVFNAGHSNQRASTMKKCLWRYLRFLVALWAINLLIACQTQTPALDSNTRSALVPTGTLRAAINFGNPILAYRGPQGEPHGVSVDLARELARRLDVPVELRTFVSAGQVVEALKANQVDIAFVAIDPERGLDVLYSPPYVIIEGAYVVKQASPIQRNEDVDRVGTRVVVGKGSAYDLYLQRELKHAQLVHAPTSPLVADVFVAQNLEVAAGVRQQLEADARRIPGLRLLDGRFMVIQQAMGTPRVRGDAGVAYLRNYIEAMKASGFVTEALKRHHIEGAGVAPSANTP